MVTVATIEKRSINQPDETKRIGRVQLDIVTIGGLKIQRDIAEPGWRWSEDVKPVVQTESCQINHLIYMLSGTLRVRMLDGTEQEFRPGDIGAISPGHDGWTVGNEPAVWLEIPH